MKFLCDKCKTRYTISDDKIRGKVLKIRCKNCGNIIEVREPASQAQRPAAQKPPSSSGVAKAQRRHGSQVARLKSSSEQRLGPASKRPEPSPLGAGARATKRPVAPRQDRRERRGSRPILPSASAADEPEQKTVIAAMPQELLQSARSKAKAERVASVRGGRAGAASVADEPADWYLGDDRGEYGPMTFSELAARVKRGEPGPNAEAWQEGMDDWLPLDEIPELKPYLKKAPPPRPTTQHPKAGPPSPLQKRPGQDAMVPSASAPVPVAPKQRPAPTELKEPLVKGPAPLPAAAVDDPWPAVPQVASDPAAAFTPEPLPVATPAPGDPAVLAPLQSAAHVSMRAASDLGTILAEQRKRDRRPILIISVASALIAGLAVVLVIWLISSGKKDEKAKAPPEVAQKDMEPKAPMARTLVAPVMTEPMAAMAPGTMEHDLSELDIDIDVGSDMGRSSSRRPNGKRPRPRATRPAPRRVASSGGGADPLALPSMRPRFVGLMGFGAPRPSSGSFGGGGGSRPGDLGTVVRRNYNRLKRCYEKAARINSRLRNPRLRISIKVSSSGKVTSVYVSPQKYAADTLGICVRRSIGAWRFPSFASSYSYSFTARFHGG